AQRIFDGVPVPIKNRITECVRQRELRVPEPGNSESDRIVRSGWSRKNVDGTLGDIVRQADIGRGNAIRVLGEEAPEKRIRVVERIDLVSDVTRERIEVFAGFTDIGDPVECACECASGIEYRRRADVDGRGKK